MTTNESATTTKQQLWSEEFDADFDVPQVISEKLLDISWHNDVSPSFAALDFENDGENPEMRLWVDHPEQCFREMNSSYRFAITKGVETLWKGNSAEIAVEIFQAIDAARRAAQVKA